MDWPSWLKQAPPAGYVWFAISAASISAIASSMSMLVSLTNLRLARGDRKTDQLIKVDEAWIKAILLEDSVPAILEFLKEQSGAITRLQTCVESEKKHKYQDAISKFNVESESLLLRLNVIKILFADESVYAELEKATEDFQDQVVKHCAANSGLNEFEIYKPKSVIDAAFAAFRGSVLSRLREEHVAKIYLKVRRPPLFMRLKNTLVAGIWPRR